MTENVDQLSELHKSEICRICLTTNVKMFSVQEYELNEKYRNVTGIQVCQYNIYPGFLCWECTHQLLSCHRFKTRAILSHCLMTGLLENDKCVTEQNISKINRHKNGLVSRLKQHINPPNCFNLEVTEEEGSDLVQNEQENNNVAVPVVKNEEDDDDDFPGEEIKEESVKLVNLNVKAESSDDDRPLTELTEKVVVIIRNNIIPKRKSTKLAESKSNKIKGVKSKTTNTTAKTKRKTQIKKNDDTVEKKTVNKKTILSELDPSDFDITTLTVEEQISEIEKRKKTKNYMESNFKCDKCYKGFMDDAAFNLHLILHTKESGEHECEICKLRFRTRRSLRRHNICHAQKFACKQCAYVTTRCRHAKLHADFHRGTTYKCPHCFQVFSKCSTYMTHLRIKHPSDIACELCGYSFVSHRGLYLHKNLMHRFEKHQPEDNVSCEQCGITFLKKEALETHLKVSPKHVTHSDGKLVKERNCREYQGKIKDKNVENIAKEKEEKKREPNRRTPKRTRKSEPIQCRTRKSEPIQCELCGAQLGGGAAYYWHFQRAHPGRTRTRYAPRAARHMCDVCGRMFTSIAALEDHKSIHGSDQQFKCPYCEKTFKRKYGVVEHLSRVHKGKKRTYGCSVCGKEFNSSFNMQRHMLVHTGVREFECLMCGKMFKDVVDRKLHITHVHMKVPWPKRNRGSRTKKQEPSRESEAEASSANTELQPLNNTEIW